MRFFVEQNDIDLDNKTAVIGIKDTKHITGSLRLRQGDIITLCDGTGMDYACEIERFCQERVDLKIINAYKGSTEPRVKVSLYQALPKYGRMEFVIEKCVELGIFEIVPVITQYTLFKKRDRIERYQKIAEAAAKQCNRGIVPAVLKPVDFTRAAAMIKKHDLAIAAWEKETDSYIKDAVLGFTGTTAGLMIGPEGGFSDGEALCFKENNIKTVNLGRRILRTETAGMVCLTVFLNETGEI